jgi:hypothetical protein
MSSAAPARAMSSGPEARDSVSPTAPKLPNTTSAPVPSTRLPDGQAAAVSLGVTESESESSATTRWPGTDAAGAHSAYPSIDHAPATPPAGSSAAMS